MFKVLKWVLLAFVVYYLGYEFPMTMKENHTHRRMELEARMLQLEVLHIEVESLRRDNSAV